MKTKRRLIHILPLFISLICCSFTSFEQEVDLSQFEKKVYSQNGEDGVIEKIFELIGTTSKTYVEFGVEDGSECNTRYFRERHHFKGLLMDIAYYNPAIGLYREKVNAENINQLFEKYNVPYEFDLLSIDIDSNDFYVWQALQYSPRVIVIEYNAHHPFPEDKVILYNSHQMWDQTTYYGASLAAMYNLAKSKGYSLVYGEKRGVNLFFIRNDIVKALPYKFKNINNPEAFYRFTFSHLPDLLNRPYINSISLLKEHLH